MAKQDKQDKFPHSLMLYDAPAEKYIEGGLPIGNGGLAAMLVGGADKDRLALNHEWLWRGKGRGRTVEPRWQHLAEVRRMFFEGKTLEAGELANASFGGGGGKLRDAGHPNRVDPYQPAGDLRVDLGLAEVTQYRRQLDLDRAVAAVSCVSGQTTYTREYFAHATLPIIVIRLTASGGDCFKAILSLTRIDDPECELTAYARGDALGLGGRFPEGIRFAVEAKVVTDGRVSQGLGASLAVEAKRATIVLSIAVNTEDGDAAPDARAQVALGCHAEPAELSSAEESLFERLLASHVEAHRELYRRVRLENGKDLRHIPMPRRLADLRAGKADEGLLSLYVNFGRYLLISSSRAGGLPANLQGKWNEDLRPPWESDYHHDVNLQMNYWPAEPFDLGECTGPLLDHIERMVPPGREAARALYNCRGVFMPITTDAWAATTPEARGWDCWVGGASWLVQHAWMRWEFSRDEDFLRRRTYPLLKEVAAFWEDYLVPHPAKGWLVAVPSYSPENTFIGGTKPVSLCVSAAMDVELAYEVLSHAAEAAAILGVDADLQAKWRQMLAKLPPLQVGKHGQLQEWLEDYDDAEPGHRHLSHLLALYPGDQLTLEGEPELTAAARKSLERRLAHFGGHTGWSRAWVVCLWARLREGDAAHDHLKHLILDFATEALLDLHPPRIFQIDGNFGGAAGIAEMLLQSHRSLIRLLPALPGAWADGKVSGLRARGGFGIDLQWKSGRPVAAEIYSACGGACRLQHADIAAARITKGRALIETRKLAADILEFTAEPGKMYKLEWACD